MRYGRRLARSVVLVAVGALGCGNTDNLVGVLGGGLPAGSGGSSDRDLGAAGTAGDSGGLGGMANGAAGRRTASAGGRAPVEAVADTGGASSGSFSGAGAGGVSGSNPVDAVEPDFSGDFEYGSADCVLRVATSGSDSNSGSSFGSALRTVRRGLTAASTLTRSGVCPSVEIWVAAGTYTPTNGSDRTATFQLLADVALFGGFAGSEAARAERNITLNVTTLSGDIGTATVTDNSYHVVTGATGATLDGFVIERGYANERPHLSGAGMYNDSASPTVANCTFTNHTAAAGAGMYNTASSPTITHCTFTDNAVMFGDGGGIHNADASSPLISDSTFSSNSAQYSGGGIYNVNSSPTITGCTFSGNDGNETGGAINNQQSSPTITGCTFTSNHAGAYGGALVNNDASSATVTGCTFSGNTSYLGGAIYDSESSPTITNSVFAGNAVSGSAKFTGDQLSSGGAIYNDASSPIVTNCTFSANTAAHSGGAIHSENSSTATVTNSILWGDLQGPKVSEIVDLDASSSTTVSHSIVQNGSGSVSGPFISADPLFVDGASGDLRLNLGSPAIDAGDACGAFVSLTDVNGSSRWDIAGVPNAPSGVDIGAFEYQGSPETDSGFLTSDCP